MVDDRPTVWHNSPPSWWAWIDCQDLFEQFEESVDSNGRATVLPAAVESHVDSCNTCWHAGIRVRTDVTGRVLVLERDRPEV